MLARAAATHPKIPRAEWHAEFDALGTSSLIGELIWMARHGSWCCARNTRPLLFGGGRGWYDGPYWFLHLGWWSVSLWVE